MLNGTCSKAGMTELEARELRSSCCEMHQCDMETYERVQVDVLTRDLKPLGRKCSD